MPGAPHKREDYIHLIGTDVDEVTVLDVFQTRMDNGALRWKVHCKCKVCGHEKDIVMQNFIKHAGTFHKYCTYNDKSKYDYLVGKTFDDCTVLKVYGRYFGKQGPYWNATCKCNVCGKVRDIFISDLLKPDNHSGLHWVCYKGLYPYRFVNLFDHIKARTENPVNPSYKDYGGRGIRCEWKYLDNFADDMLKAYLEKAKEIGEDNVSLERKDVNGNYCKENCCWIDRRFQAYNKRNTIHFLAIDPKGVEYYGKCLGLFCKRHKLDENAMRRALNTTYHRAPNNWSIRRISKEIYDKYFISKFNVPADIDFLFDCIHRAYEFRHNNPIHLTPDGYTKITQLMIESENALYIPPEAIPVLCSVDNDFNLEINFNEKNKCFLVKKYEK